MKQQRVANIILPSMDIKKSKRIKNYHLVPSLHKIKDISKKRKIISKSF